MALRTSQPERMINLLALLVQRTQPLTLKQIRQELVNQYPDGDSAARAAFERDKAQLRALGIPMDMVTLGGDKFLANLLQRQRLSSLHEQSQQVDHALGLRSP